jgi:hypothetical protein
MIVVGSQCLLSVEEDGKVCSLARRVVRKLSPAPGLPCVYQVLV